MPSRSTPISYNEFYHCYNRGTDKRKIFLSNNDYHRFTALLYVCNSDTPIHLSNLGHKKPGELFDLERGASLVSIGAWCLMPNHFHLLLKETTEGGISKFMNKLLTAYSKYFNIRHNRTGTLFEGRFFTQHASKDYYLKYLFSYIHLNPIKIIDSKWKEKGISNHKLAINFLNNYFYSSYLDYKTNLRPQARILSKNEFPVYFNNKKEFVKNILDWMSYKKE